MTVCGERPRHIALYGTVRAQDLEKQKTKVVCKRFLGFKMFKAPNP